VNPDIAKAAQAEMARDLERNLGQAIAQGQAVDRLRGANFVRAVSRRCGGR